MRRLHFVSLLTLFACGGAPPPSSDPPPAPVVLQPAPSTPLVADALPEAPPQEDTARYAERALQGWSTQSACDDFDYFPNGGLQNFWCHRAPSVQLQKLREVSGVRLFVSGPHRDDELELTSSSEFGHYNPAFVRWLREHGASPRGSAMQLATQPAYDKFLAPLARIFWLTHQKLESAPACTKRELLAYEAAIKKKRAGYYERWFFFMNPAFCDAKPHPDSWYYSHGMDGGVDGNVTKTVVGFWLRRMMDGTYTEFAGGLRELIASYEPALLAE